MSQELTPNVKSRVRNLEIGVEARLRLQASTLQARTAVAWHVPPTCIRFYTVTVLLGRTRLNWQCYRSLEICPWGHFTQFQLFWNFFLFFCWAKVGGGETTLALLI
jgi:hypothetical protein